MMKKIIATLGLLLIPSFSFAWNELILPGNGADMGNSNYCVINSDLSFSCTESNNIFQNVGNPAWGNYSTSYWWNNDGLSFYKYESTNSECSFQGVITGFTFCQYDFVGNNSLQINNSMYWSNCFSKTYSYDEFSQYVSSHELKYWSPVSFSTVNGYAGLVFVFDEGAFRVQFDVGSNLCTNFMYGNYGLKDFGLIGLTPDFTNVDIVNSPTTNNNTTTPPTPPTQYTCPTIQQLINTYPEQYNTGLCYSSNMIYSGGSIQTITPKTIFELYPTRKELNQDVQNYNTYCNNVATQQACQTIFEEKNEEYTLIAKIPQNVMPMQLYAYCNLTLNQDPNSTTCTASTGAINNGIGIDDIIDNIGKTPITVITPGTPPDAPEETGNQNIYGEGSVYDKYKQDEDNVKRRNIIKKAEDTIQTMREIYTKLTGIFRARSGRQGVIPPLITGLIALIILFKLFKK